MPDPSDPLTEEIPLKGIESISCHLSLACVLMWVYIVILHGFVQHKHIVRRKLYSIE